MTRPNFLIIGAGKSGTTSVYRYLQQHPQVFMSPLKEPHFLTYEGIAMQAPSLSECHSFPPGSCKTLATYEALFAEAGDAEIALGEASVSYLAFPEQVILAIQKYMPHAKLIAFLRQPAERAFSAYLHQVRNGMESTIQFAKVVAEKQCWDFAKTGNARRDFNRSFCFKDGYYFSQLSPFYHAFSSRRIRVYLYDDLAAAPLTVLRDLFGFLGVDDKFEPDVSEYHNKSVWPQSHTTHRVLNKISAPVWLRRGWGMKERLMRLNYRKPPRLDPLVRQQLTEHYRQDILQLQGLIGRDLTHWLKVPAEQ